MMDFRTFDFTIFFDSLSLEDKVIAKNVGSVGIILTRRYLLYIAMVLAALLSIYTFVLVEENAHGHRAISKLTWD